jgi:hypothetical protein
LADSDVGLNYHRRVIAEELVEIAQIAESFGANV